MLREQIKKKRNLNKVYTENKNKILNLRTGSKKYILIVM